MAPSGALEAPAVPPLGAAVAPTRKVPPMSAFGRVILPRPRDSPYGSMLEEGQATLAQAEALLVDTQEYGENPEPPDLGGLLVKVEPASA